uniref:tRNA (adenine(58)-N(1))-methyltransferase n=1 Tax=Periophthalmus magnuspinnatus TaxID=409849 RepID=A0A3B3Z9N1_9GOBI
MSLKALPVHRLLRACASGHHSITMFLKVRNNMQKGTLFSTGYVIRVENDDTNHSIPNLKLTSKQAQFSKRRRPLSPLERISSLLPQDSLIPEVELLRDQDQSQHQSVDRRLFDHTALHSVEEECGYPGLGKGNEMEEDAKLTDTASSDVDITDNSFTSVPLHHPCLKGETLLTFGEFLVAEYRKKGHLEFRKMFQLQPRARLQSSWGVIPHEEIAGAPAGSFLKTNRGISILIRRASLEDYVLFMRRGPAISYPKDAATLLMMMDVTEGDCVLEAGSGSGALSLFLSRAVGTSGKVVSVEVREDHLKRAVLNYKQWRTSWELRRGQPWPDNVQFVHADLCTTPVLEDWGFHAVALDLINPHLVLSTVIPHLHSGAVCAVYLAKCVVNFKKKFIHFLHLLKNTQLLSFCFSITQVIDLLEGLRCLRVPLLCERIVELPVRDWLVAPALQKDGTYCLRKFPTMEENSEENGALKQDQPGTNKTAKLQLKNTSLMNVFITEQLAAFGSIPYIARPHPQQLSHTGMSRFKASTGKIMFEMNHSDFFSVFTAFLVKLRKHV